MSFVKFGESSSSTSHVNVDAFADILTS